MQIAPPLLSIIYALRWVRGQRLRANLQSEQPRVLKNRYELAVTRPRGRGSRASSASAACSGEVVSPMPGKVVRVMAEAGQEVSEVSERKKARNAIAAASSSAVLFVYVA